MTSPHELIQSHARSLALAIICLAHLWTPAWDGDDAGIPSETDVKEKGLSLGEMQAKLLAKVEELTLHMIQAEERNDHLERQNKQLQDRIARIEARSATR